MAEIDWNDRALAIYLGAVSEYVAVDLARQVTAVAIALAPVRARHTAVPPWARRGYVGTPGRLKASVSYDTGYDTYGFYADVSSLWYGRFMDPKARQLHYLRPFLPTALYSTVAGRVYHIG